MSSVCKDLFSLTNQKILFLGDKWAVPPRDAVDPGRVHRAKASAVPRGPDVPGLDLRRTRKRRKRESPNVESDIGANSTDDAMREALKFTRRTLTRFHLVTPFLESWKDRNFRQHRYAARAPVNAGSLTLLQPSIAQCTQRNFTVMWIIQSRWPRSAS